MVSLSSYFVFIGNICSTIQWDSVHPEQRCVPSRSHSGAHYRNGFTETKRTKAQADPHSVAYLDKWVSGDPENDPPRALPRMFACSSGLLNLDQPYY
jgi:hypothetical protein